MTTIQFKVDGTPIPQGSMKCVGKVGGKRHQLIHSNDKELMGWRDAVRKAAQEVIEVAGLPAPYDLPVAVVYEFVSLPPHRRKFPIHATKPDVEKLTRAVNDALTGVLFVDDSRVAAIVEFKRYARAGETAHLKVTAKVLEEVEEVSFVERWVLYHSELAVEG